MAHCRRVMAHQLVLMARLEVFPPSVTALFPDDSIYCHEYSGEEGEKKVGGGV